MLTKIGPVRKVTLAHHLYTAPSIGDGTTDAPMRDVASWHFCDITR